MRAAADCRPEDHRDVLRPAWASQTGLWRPLRHGTPHREAITLQRGASEKILTGSRPGTTFNIGELGPVLEAFGLLVKEAAAVDDGTLRLCFQGDLVLCVIPSTGY